MKYRLLIFKQSGVFYGKPCTFIYRGRSAWCSLPYTAPSHFLHFRVERLKVVTDTFEDFQTKTIQKPLVLHRNAAKSSFCAYFVGCEYLGAKWPPQIALSFLFYSYSLMRVFRLSKDLLPLQIGPVMSAQRTVVFKLLKFYMYHVIIISRNNNDIN